jgi:hypothetical protein
MTEPRGVREWVEGLESRLGSALAAARADETLNEQVVDLGLQLAAALKVVEAARAWANDFDTPTPEVVMRLMMAVEAWEAGA